MSQSSKWSSGRLHRSGIGGSCTIQARLPVAARRLPRAPSLDPRAEFRLRCIEHATRHGVAAAVIAFGRPRSTIYRWIASYDPSDLRSLQPRSRRPHRTRRQQWSAPLELAVLEVRQQFPRTGKAKLVVLLARQGIVVSESTIGRILASLRRRRLLIEPAGLRPRIRRTQRPFAIRVPKDKRAPSVPGAMIQLDTMHLRPLPGVERRQFTAIDVVSRIGVLGIRSQATAGTASAFLDDLVDRMPFPIQAIQVDGGSEFMAEFETECHAKGIVLYVLPPRSPKLNGRVERLNGTVRREFWECYHGDCDLPSMQQALRDFEETYNHHRPHQALDYATPAAHLATLSVSYVSN